MAKANMGASGLCCSFCHKSQESVAKLISSPSDYARAYICDECITVCSSILEDDRGQLPESVAKLISSPSDYARAYICDECITVCSSILEDDRGQLPPVSEMPVNPSEK